MRCYSVAFQVALAVAFGLVPDPAFAHLVNTNVGEFYAGMLHPLTSAEHLLPAVALALLAGWCGTQAARWTVGAFPLALVVGTWAGNHFMPLGLAYPANLLAMIGLGLLLVAARRMPPMVVGTAAALVGLILGYRSGVDMAQAGVGLQFIPGVGLTGLIIAALGSAWIPSASSPPVGATLRLAGGALVVAGIYMLAGVMGDGAPIATSTAGLPTEERLTALVQTDSLTLPVIVGTFLAAIAWGAAHALTPGHGKTIVGAYLVGSRGSPRHALYLGLTVTATHTIGVFVLGLVALLASQYVAAEQLLPWLAAVSGLVVCGLGASMLAPRARPLFRRHTPHEHAHQADHRHVHRHHQHHHGHHHGHSHLPPGANGAPVTLRALLGLGISGGLLPCPSAFVLLLTAVSLQRAGFGLLLVLAFSLGLAGVLTGVGLLFIKGSQLLQNTPGAATVSRYVPAVSAMVILIIGVGITVDAVLKLASTS